MLVLFNNCYVLDYPCLIFKLVGVYCYCYKYAYTWVLESLWTTNDLSLFAEAIAM